MTALEYTGISRCGCRAAAAATMLARAKAFLGRLREKHQAHVALRQLQSMSDWQLKDIGIERGQIRYLTCRVGPISGRNRHAEH